MIQLKNISKIYKTKDKSTIALDDLSFSLPSKGFISILGPSGCGKTSLLNILGGLDGPTSGEYIYNNKNTKNSSNKTWDSYRQHDVGFVFQSYNLIKALTVEQNLAIVLLMLAYKAKDISKKVNKILEDFGLSGEKKKYPHELSGGQQQRLAIARALIKEPKIILVDEPTGALDSKTAESVMVLLKEAAQNCLVIMVSHNEKLAKTYSDRIINLYDGKIIVDTQTKQEKEIEQVSQTKKARFAPLAALLIGAKHLHQKLIRSLLIILASSIGIMAVTLVLTISNGVKKYIIDIQRETLSNSPITIRSTVDNTNPNLVIEELSLYPTDKIIHITNKYQSYFNHVNLFSNHFLEYLKDLDESYYNIIDYQTSVDMKLFSRFNGQVRKISTSRFMMMASDSEYIASQYELLDGKMPQEMGELAILVDRYNSIDINILSSLGIDYEGIDTYSFEEIFAKEYKIIPNNQYYYQRENGTYSYYSSGDYEQMYNQEENISLKITGILRLSKDAKAVIYDSGILYSQALRDYLLDDALESIIGQEQIAKGLDKNVFTGAPFVDLVSTSGTRTKEYQYNLQLISLGLLDQISLIRIYTDQFDARVKVNEYLEDYNKNQNQGDKILYSDYMGDFAREFDAFVEILTKTLLLFTIVSLFISSIMIGIITFISVMERIREIGILRSLGFGKRFIRYLFNFQNAIIGGSAAIVGIAGGALLMKPIVALVVNIMERNSITTFNISSLKFTSFGIFYFVLIVIANIALAVIAGSVPAFLASRLKPVEAINKE